MIQCLLSPGVTLVVQILLVLAVLGCLRLARQEDVNTLCAISLVVALAGWILSLGGSRTVSLVVGVLAGGASLLLALLGVLGREESRGRSQAALATALVLGLFLLNGIQIAREMAGHLGGIPSVPAAEQPAAKNRTLTFERYNCRFTSPGGPWAKVEGSQFHPHAIVALARAEPSMVFILVADVPGVEKGLTTRSILQSEVALRKVGSDSAATILDQHAHRLNELDGVRWLTQAQVGSRWLSYVQWGFANRGFTYQLVIWGDRSQAQQIRQESERLFARFGLLEPKRVVHVGEGLRSSDRLSQRFGYKIGLADTAWVVQPDPSQGNAAADSFARYLQRGALVVMPVDLGRLAPSLDLLRGAFIKQLGFRIVSAVTRISQKGAPGQVFSHQGKGADGLVYHYRMRVLKWGGFGYLLLGWAREASAIPLLDEGLDRFEMVETLRNTRELTPRESLAHARMFNSMGVSEYQAGHHAQAVKYLRAAFECRLDDPVMLSNLIGAHRKSGQRQEALAYLKRHIHRFPGHRVLASLLRTLERR